MLCPLCRHTPQSVSITEDKLGIRLPNGPGGDNNYVLGLALDTSTPLVRGDPGTVWGSRQSGWGGRGGGSHGRGRCMV